MLKKLLDTFSRFSPREKWILIGTSLILTVLFLDRLVAGPVIQKLQLLDQQIKEEKISAKKSMLVLLRKDQITVEKQAFSNFSIEAGNAEEEMTGLLKTIESLAEKASVNLLYVKPGNMEASGQLKKYTANLECEADMPRLTAFFHQIESSQRLLQIEKFEIQPQSKEKDRESTTTRCSITVSKTVVLG